MSGRKPLRSMREMPRLRLATVFSGIGAIEQALLRMHLHHELVFACDNGDQTPYPCLADTYAECKSEYKRLLTEIRMMRPVSTGQKNAYAIICRQRDKIAELMAGEPPTSTRPSKELRDRVHMLHEGVGFYNFRIKWEAGKNHVDRKLLRSLRIY